MAFNLAEAAGLGRIVSKLDTGDVRQIPLVDIDPNDKNFFDVSDVQDLMESIEVHGVLQPLVVVEHGQGYRLLAGHRRLKALQQLHEADKMDKRWATALCVVLPPMSDAMEQMVLIQTNTTARQLSYAEKMESAARLKKILVQLKSEGVKLPGRLRDIQAEQLEISRAELARMEVIQKNLIPPLMKRLKSGQINSFAAYELSRLEAEDQIVFEKKYQNDEIKPVAAVVAKYREKKSLDWLRADCPGEALGYTDHQLRENGKPIECRNWEAIRDHKAKGHPELCPGCCYACDKETCKARCQQAKIKRRKERDEIEKRAWEHPAQEEAKPSDDPVQDQDHDFSSLPISKFPQRLKEAMDLRQVSISGLSLNLDEMMRKYPQIGLSGDDDDGSYDEVCEMLNIENMDDFDFSRATYTGFVFLLSEALGVSIDWLLGRTDDPEV